MESFHLLFTALLLWTTSAFSQTKPTKFITATNYDARVFLSRPQTVAFNRLYSEFDSAKAIKDWEWKDVDPFGLFTPEENRVTRRELFLFEYDPKTIGTETPTTEQLAFKLLVAQRIEGAEILIDNSNIKILSPYATAYEKKLPIANLLEKLADLGLQWAQAGGQNLYIYNGSILIGKYKSGYVSSTDLNIDKPFKVLKKT